MGDEITVDNSDISELEIESWQDHAEALAIAEALAARAEESDGLALESVDVAVGARIEDVAALADLDPADWSEVRAEAQAMAAE